MSPDVALEDLTQVFHRMILSRFRSLGPHGLELADVLFPGANEIRNGWLEEILDTDAFSSQSALAAALDRVTEETLTSLSHVEAETLVLSPVQNALNLCAERNCVHLAYALAELLVRITKV